MGFFDKPTRVSHKQLGKALLYISPDLVDQIRIMTPEEFETFQNSPEFVHGGRLLEISRQYRYYLRKVADLEIEDICFDTKLSASKKANHMDARPKRKAAVPAELSPEEIMAQEMGLA